MNRSARVSDRWVEPMSAAPAPTLGQDRDSLPPKKRDPRMGVPEPCPAATFKVPYPYKSQHAVKNQYTLHPDFLQPLPAPVTNLYQPWVQSHTATRSKPYTPSPVRNRHGLAEWRDLYHRSMATVDSRWDCPLIHRGHLTGRLRELSASALPLDRPRQPTRVGPAILSTEGLHGMGSGYRWESSTAQGQTGPHAGRPSGLHVRGQGSQGSQSQRSLWASPAPLIRESFSHSYEGPSELANTEQTAAAVKSTLGPFPSDQTTEKYWTSGMATDAVVCPPSCSLRRSSSSSSSSSSDQPPWLLPHFAAGSLIELRDGRLRRVEDLQMEDFQMGVAACPELRLRCCTVQHISPAASPSLSRLLILLHEEHSQELVDVFVEYPFFVCGRGWSSCCPQRTASLCGLRCHQLSVGDICLALTPVSPCGTRTPAQGPGIPANGAEGRPGSLPRSCALRPPAPPPAPDRPNVGQGGGGVEPTRSRRRRRRWSAPELPGPEAGARLN